jgi:uncharacterized FlaG/YvyC family protein
MTQTTQSDIARPSKRDTTALVLLGAMFIALAMIGSASLSAVGPSAFQDIVSAIGFGRSAAIEAEQRRQAAVLDALGEMVHTVSADVGSLSTRVKFSAQHDVTVSDRFALLDADIAALVAEIRLLRTTAAERAPETVIRVDHTQTAMQSDILALRSSFDAHEQTYRTDMASMSKRIDRLEQIVNRDVTSSIRPQVRRTKVRRIQRGISTPRVNNTPAPTVQAIYLPDQPY